MLPLFPWFSLSCVDKIPRKAEWAKGPGPADNKRKGSIRKSAVSLFLFRCLRVEIERPLFSSPPLSLSFSGRLLLLLLFSPSRDRVTEIGQRREKSGERRRVSFLAKENTFHFSSVESLSLFFSWQLPVLSFLLTAPPYPIQAKKGLVAWYTEQAQFGVVGLKGGWLAWISHDGKKPTG